MLIRRTDGLSVAQQSNAAADAGARFVAIYNDKTGLNTAAGGTGVHLKVPTVHLSHEDGLALLGHRSRPVDLGGTVRSPYLYELVLTENQRVPAGLHYVARTSKLARVTSNYHSEVGNGISMSTDRFNRAPWETFSVSTIYPLIGAPRTRTEYLTAAPDVAWSAAISAPETRWNNAWPHPKTGEILLDAPHWSTYRPGQRVSADWLKAPLVPGQNPYLPAARQGDLFRVDMKGVVDAAGNDSDTYTNQFPNGFKTDFRMYRGAM